MKRWIILFSIITFILGVYSATKVEAAEIVNARILSLDQQTLQKGFTVKSQDDFFWLPVFPNKYKENVTVKIEEWKTGSQVPENKKKISKYYFYDFKKKESGMLKEPLLLSLKFFSDNATNKAIYFYDNHQNKWRSLPSKIDSENNLIRAYTPFPCAQVAVFEENNIKDSKDEISSSLNILSSEENLTAQAALVLDLKNNQAVFSENIDEQRSIASLTKLMSIAVFLDHNPGWNKLVTIEQADFVGGASLWVKVGDQVTVKDLFNAVLIGSKNNATMALARSTGLSQKIFIQKMNEKAKIWGLSKTYFVEPTGLSEKNVSTAKEISLIAKNVFSNLEVLQSTTTSWYKVKPVNSELHYWVKNTSKKVLDSDLYVTGTKTGWTDEAGYCLITKAKQGEKEYLAVVLGAEMTKNYEEVYYLLDKYL